ncbi:DUF3261 domain-containing protein [Thiotrichales bacterium 19S3-7]|nr:DUF3261 domain-containing protein [Thiotrichales bacterium 19S3-7]MCF6800587.1 DUF3261 domain-containing protein [Thiotrichales bacterium 19S3-11]
MKSIQIFLILSLCSILSACALLRVKSTETPEVNITQGVKVHLPTPEELDIQHKASQILSASYTINDKTQTYTSEVIVEVDSKHIILVAASGWGGTIFSIDYDGETINSSSLPMPNAAMGIKHTLSDFIFTYASEKVLKSMLKDSQIQVKMMPKMRIFYLKNKKIMQITYANDNPWLGTIKLKNFIYHYTINIQNLTN